MTAFRLHGVIPTQRVGTVSFRALMHNCSTACDQALQSATLVDVQLATPRPIPREFEAAWRATELEPCGARVRR